MSVNSYLDFPAIWIMSYIHFTYKCGINSSSTEVKESFDTDCSALSILP